MRSRTIWLDIVAADLDAEVAVSYTPGCAASWTDPGEGPEIDVGPFVRYAVGDGVEVTKWDVLALWHAAENKLTLEQAENELREMLVERAEDYLRGEWEDAQERSND